MTTPVASVIVRTRDSSATVVAALDSLRGQTVPVEIVVVDSGSTDDTLALVAPYADVVVHVPPGEFTFGRALNLGAAAATAPLHVALSSHCALPRADWVERAAQHLARPEVVATCGLPVDAAGDLLNGPVDADHAHLVEHRRWGLTNHASAWTAEAWRRDPFDEQLPASEDKAWSWAATARGAVLVVDPALVVPGDHRRAQGVRAYYRRLRKELAAEHLIDPLDPFPLSEALADWARAVPRDPALTRARRLGRTRLVEVAARWTAGRDARRAG